MKLQITLRRIILIGLATLLMLVVAEPLKPTTTQAAPSQATIIAIGVAKQATSIVNNGNGTYDITYLITVRNYSPTALVNVQVTENLVGVYPAPATFVVVGAPTTSAANLVPNPGFNGVSDPNLLNAASSTLPVGATAYTITFVVRVTPNGNYGPYNNSVVATGQDTLGNTTSDISNTGINPNPDNDNDPTNNNTPTTVQLIAPAPTQVPEGDTLLLVGAGLAGLAGYARLRLRARRADKRKINS